jgi:hypothetical protein
MIVAGFFQALNPGASRLLLLEPTVFRVPIGSNAGPAGSRDASQARNGLPSADAAL